MREEVYYGSIIIVNGVVCILSRFLYCSVLSHSAAVIHALYCKNKAEDFN